MLVGQRREQQLGRGDVGFDRFDRRVDDQLHADRRRQVIDLVDVATSSRTSAVSVTSPRTNVSRSLLADRGQISAAPVDSSSTTVTRRPAASSSSVRWLPMKPAPPVTRAC